MQIHNSTVESIGFDKKPALDGFETRDRHCKNYTLEMKNIEPMRKEYREKNSKM
jgi:hypothetical protein